MTVPDEWPSRRASLQTEPGLQAGWRIAPGERVGIARHQRQQEPATMTTPWKYQIRIDLPEPLAEAARRNEQDPALEQLSAILARHRATMKSQYDAFADYVAEAERNGIDKYPLYHWTRATIENPDKKTKYTKSFTIYVCGEEVYAQELADALEADLQPLLADNVITRLAKHDTNPANNPQPPARFRK
jgi:hypothetical protein